MDVIHNFSFMLRVCIRFPPIDSVDLVTEQIFQLDAHGNMFLDIFKLNVDFEVFECVHCIYCIIDSYMWIYICYIMVSISIVNLVLSSFPVQNIHVVFV